MARRGRRKNSHAVDGQGKSVFQVKSGTSMSLLIDHVEFVGNLAETGA